jgi:endonuclease/exonuclease/phosphatase family metal-dependent hydrolase
MRLPPFLIAVAYVASGCTPQPPPAAARSGSREVLRVATWNVHDLFDAEDRLLPPGELDTVPSLEAAAGKLSRVAAVLTRIDADLVLLQEVENLPLAEALAQRAGYLEARLVEGYDPRGIDVALLSRYPVDRYVSHLGERAADGRPLWSRDCVEARVAAPGGAVVLVLGHLVSRLTDPTGDRRREQAARMREIADEAASANPGALVVVGGDLNDEPWNAPLAPLLADGAWTEPLSVLGAAGSWTWLGNGGGARLDYLLVAREEARRVASASVVEGTDVAAASDHRPVVLELEWGR